MHYSEYRFTLDLHKHQSQQSIAVFKGDTAVRLYISLTDGGKPYTIGQGSYAVFFGKRPDDEPLLHSCKIDEERQEIIYEFQGTVSEIVGTVDCQCRLYGADQKLITAPRFAIVVDERIVGDDEEIEIPGSTLSALDDIILADIERGNAEAARVYNEDVRNRNESIRQEEHRVAMQIAIKNENAIDEAIKSLTEPINDMADAIVKLEDTSAGRTDGIGEIFNDYENNTANQFSHVEGENNKDDMSPDSGWNHIDGGSNTAKTYDEDVDPAEYNVGKTKVTYTRMSGKGNRALAGYGDLSGTGNVAGYVASAGGGKTKALADYSSTKGQQTVARYGANRASVEGNRTIATCPDQHVQGRYNIEDTDKKFAHIIGNGSGEDDRRNAHTVDWDGNAWYAGGVECNGDIRSGGNIQTKKLKLNEDIESLTSGMSSLFPQKEVHWDFDEKGLIRLQPTDRILNNSEAFVEKIGIIANGNTAAIEINGLESANNLFLVRDRVGPFSVASGIGIIEELSVIGDATKGEIRIRNISNETYEVIGSLSLTGALIQPCYVSRNDVIFAQCYCSSSSNSKKVRFQACRFDKYGNRVDDNNSQVITDEETQLDVNISNIERITMYLLLETGFTLASNEEVVIKLKGSYWQNQPFPSTQVYGIIDFPLTLLSSDGIKSDGIYLKNGLIVRYVGENAPSVETFTPSYKMLVPKEGWIKLLTSDTIGSCSIGIDAVVFEEKAADKILIEKRVDEEITITQDNYLTYFDLINNATNHVELKPEYRTSGKLFRLPASVRGSLVLSIREPQTVRYLIKERFEAVRINPTKIVPIVLGDATSPRSWSLNKYVSYTTNFAPLYIDVKGSVAYLAPDYEV